MLRYSLHILLFYSLIFSFDDPIIAKIKDRTITKSDFIKRAEYTIRPAYCKDDNPIHKKIILNSLIAEKLMAIDIESFINDNNFSSNFLSGIKEQKMREVLLNSDVYSKISVDSSIQSMHLKNSIRTYNFNFVSLENDTIAAFFQSYLKEGINFDNICYNYLMLESIPSRELGYFDENDPNIHNAIFLKDLNKNDILGPIISKDNKYLFLKVVDWKNSALISDQQISDHVRLVKNKVSTMEQEKAYNEFVLEIMKGDRLNFSEDLFFKLADIAYNFYFNKLQSQESIDQKYNDQSLDLIYFSSKLDIKKEDVFLKFNEENITIEKLDFLISKHPLVFTKSQMNESEFPIYFKYAIVDLIRDEEINKLAYSYQYDAHPEVIKELEMFNDATLSQLHLKALLDRNNITEDQFEKNTTNILDAYLNTYVDSLQNKYFNDIQIDFDVFNQIKITSIDLYTYKKGVPYPSVVPLFPILTSKHVIDYGIKSNF